VLGATLGLTVYTAAAFFLGSEEIRALPRLLLPHFR
jgi:hypothetical protein